MYNLSTNTCTRAALYCLPQELRRQDPQLLQQIQANQGEFMRMVMEPGEGEGDDMAELLQAMAGGAGGGAGGLPPGVVQVGWLCQTPACAVGSQQAGV
jgi:hypothetical protein